MKEWLKNLKVGNTVVVFGRNFKRICTVDRLTKTQVVVGGLKYRISDGGLVDENNWNYESLHEPTEKLINTIKNKQKNTLIKNIKMIGTWWIRESSQDSKQHITLSWVTAPTVYGQAILVHTVYSNDLLCGKFIMN